VRKYWVGLTAAAGLASIVTWCGPSLSAASASPLHATHPSGCKHVSYTGDGGYYSQGQFYWQPGDDATITTHWCYSDGVITSHSATYTTNIPTAQQPRFTVTSSLVKKGKELDVELSGDYLSGVINNVGFLSLAGDVTASGHHAFADVTNAGG
jgi:hypothetical protein